MVFVMEMDGHFLFNDALNTFLLWLYGIGRFYYEWYTYNVPTFCSAS